MLEQQKQMTQENPYVFIPIDLEHYYGSQYLLNVTLRAIGNADYVTLELIGFNGMGKTSLFHYILYPNVIENRKDLYQEPYKKAPNLIFPVSVEFSAMSDDIHPIQYIYQCFIEAFSKYQRQVNSTEIIINELNLDLNFDAINDQGKDVKANNILITIVKKLITDLSRLKSKGIKPVFFLDDFDLVFDKINAGLINNLKSWRNYATFIISTERSLYDINIYEASKLFGQGVMHRVIGLNKDEKDHLLKDPMDIYEVQFPDQEKLFIKDLAGNHPAFLILAARFLWEMRQQCEILNDSNKLLTKNQKEELEIKLLLQLDRRLEKTWTNLSLEEREIVKALASGKNIQYDYSNLSHKNLFELGVIEKKETKDNDFYLKLCSGIFRQFILKRENNSPTKTEIRIYEFFKNNPNEDISFRKIFNEIWPQENYTEKEKTRIQVNVSRLRSKLNLQIDEIINVRDVGYRYEVKGKDTKNAV